MTPTLPTEVKAANIRIDRALAQPGAKGKRGFLLWVQAAFPKKVADAVAMAASKHIPPGGFAGLGYVARTQWKSPAMFQGLGDDSGLMTIGVDDINLTPSVSQSVADATDSSAASSSWLSDILSAFSSATPALTQAYLTKQQLSNAQTIFNTNLQRAQQGLPPLPTNPAQYGQLSPSLNFGLTSGTQNALLWAAGGLGAIFLVSQLMKGGSPARRRK